MPNTKTQFSSARSQLVLTAVLAMLLISMPACQMLNDSLNQPAQTAAPAVSEPTLPAPRQTVEITPATTAARETDPTPPETAPAAAVSGSDGPAAALLPSSQTDLADLPEVPEYRIDLEIDDSLVEFSGRMQLDFTNLEEAALDRLFFRLLPNGGKSYGSGSLTVSAAAVDGEPAENHVDIKDATILELILPAGLPPGESVQIELSFAGKVPQDFGGGEEPDGYGIYNLTEEVLALSGWYPVLAVYDQDGWNLDPVSAMGDSLFSETGLYRVRLCAPTDLVIAATGVLVNRQAENGLDCSEYESGPVRDFFIIASPNFERLSQEADGVTIYSYYLPNHESAAAQALEVAVDSLKIYNDKFGAYPFVELDVVDAPMRNALGVEFPGIVLVASSLYDDPGRSDFDIATSHEVGHQWWYSVVGNDVFEEPWLDEGLTTFTSSLYYEYAQAPGMASGLWEFWQQRYERLKQDNRDAPVTEPLAYFEEDPGGRSYSGVVYIKGGLFFKALREEIGDEAFFGALQQYYQDHKYGVARGEDLLAAFETAAGRELDDFYQQWLFPQEN